MADLPAHPTLPELQRYMDEICKERGWTKDSYAEKFLLFTELHLTDRATCVIVGANSQQNFSTVDVEEQCQLPVRRRKLPT
jgi:hypothetical protein